MQRLRGRNTKGDGPPVFSHEFIIQNHADIISCVCMVIFLGLIPQATNKTASSFIFVQYNATVNATDNAPRTGSARVEYREPLTVYHHGMLDALNVLFYAMVWIIIHALLQEYIWERTVKRLHLSKVKTSKYYDSGCLVVFYFVSLVWGLDYLIKENLLLNPAQLWDGYPHDQMKLSIKFYMLNQMAFWLHCYPELYFMKAKREELYPKLVLYTSSFLIIAGAYILQLQRLALVLLVLHYFVEFLFHASRLLHYHGKTNLSNPGFRAWMVLFVLARFLTVGVSVLTLWFGLGTVKPTVPQTQETVSDVVEGEETPVGERTSSTQFVLVEATHRLGALAFIILIQLWVFWTFLRHQLDRSSEDKSRDRSSSAQKAPKKGNDVKKTDKSPKPAKEEKSPKGGKTGKVKEN